MSNEDQYASRGEMAATGVSSFVGMTQQWLLREILEELKAIREVLEDKEAE